MKPVRNLTKRKPGRPLSFDRHDALRRAMLLFWRHGYESTSISDLTAELGITPPSLYAAFGDKKQLFLEAVRLYTSGTVTSETIIKEAATARDAATRLLQVSAMGFTGPETPKGCLLASAAITGSISAEDVKEHLAAIRRRTEGRLASKARHDVKNGKLPSNFDVAAEIGHVMAVIQGMSTLARDGASRRKLLRLAIVALRCWPAVQQTKRI